MSKIAGFWKSLKIQIAGFGKVFKFQLNTTQKKKSEKIRIFWGTIGPRDTVKMHIILFPKIKLKRIKLIKTVFRTLKK